MLIIKFKSNYQELAPPVQANLLGGAAISQIIFTTLNTSVHIIRCCYKVIIIITCNFIKIQTVFYMDIPNSLKLDS